MCVKWSIPELVSTFSPCYLTVQGFQPRAAPFHIGAHATRSPVCWPMPNLSMGSLSQHWYSGSKAEGKFNILALNLFSLLKQIRSASSSSSFCEGSSFWKGTREEKRWMVERVGGWVLLSRHPGQGLGFRSKTWKISVWCVFSWQPMSILFTAAKNGAELVVLTDMNHHSACQPGAQAPSGCFLGARLCAGPWNGNMGKT